MADELEKRDKVVWSSHGRDHTPRVVGPPRGYGDRTAGRVATGTSAQRR